MTAAEAAGRGRPARPGRAAAERPRPALQKTAAGAPGRSHRAAGAGGGGRRCLAPRDRPAARPAEHRPCSPDRLRGRSELLGLRGPAARTRYASALCPQLGPALPAWPGPRRDGAGTAPRSRRWAALWAPSSPRGLTHREDRRRWVWAEQARTEGAGVLRGWARQGEKGGSRAAVGCGREREQLPVVLSGKSLTPAPSNSCHLGPPVDVKRMPGCLPVDSVGTMASLCPSPHI